MHNIRICCLPDSPVLTARLRAAVGGSGMVSSFAVADDVIGLITQGQVHCTVVAVDVDMFERDIGNIRRLRDAFPGHPIVAWCELRTLSSRQLLDIAAFGVADIAFSGVNDSRYALGQLLSLAVQRNGARQLESRFADIFPGSLRPLFLMALERAGEPLDVERAAAALGVTRQTLRNRLVHYGLPQPQTLLVWCRLLVAGMLLGGRGRTLDSVAMQLNFSSGQNLGAALRRYVGANITSLRQGEVGPTVEAEFRRIVMRGRARADAARAARTRDSLPAPSPAD